MAGFEWRRAPHSSCDPLPSPRPLLLLSLLVALLLLGLCSPASASSDSSLASPSASAGSDVRHRFHLTAFDSSSSSSTTGAREYGTGESSSGGSSSSSANTGAASVSSSSSSLSSASSISGSSTGASSGSSSSTAFYLDSSSSSSTDGPPDGLPPSSSASFTFSSSSSSSSSSASLPPVIVDFPVNQLNVTLGLLQALSGVNTNIAFSVPVGRALNILNSFLADSSFIYDDLQSAILPYPNTTAVRLADYFQSANVTYILADSACNPSQAVLATINLLKDNEGIVGLLGPTCSAGALTSNLIASYYMMPQISYTASAVSLSNQQTFPYFFRVVTNDAYRLSVVVAMMAAYGWHHVACIFSSDSFGVSAYQQLQAQAQLAGIQLVSPQTFATGASLSSVSTQVNALRDSGANVFLLWATLTDCRTVLLAAQIAGLTGLRTTRYENNGKYVWIIPPSCTTNYSSANQTVQRAYLGTVTMLNTIPNPTAPLYVKLNAQYNALYGAGTSQLLDYAVYCAFDSVLAFLYAFAYTMKQLYALPSALTGPNVRAALLYNVSFAGASGTVNFGAAADVNATFRIAAFYPLDGDDITGNAVINLTTAGNATIRAFTTVPIAAYQNSSNLTPFWVMGRASAAPDDGFIAPTGDGASSSNTDIGGVGRDAFIAIVTATIGGFLVVMLFVWLALYSWRMRMKRIEDELNNARRAATEGKERAQTSNKAKSQFLANMSHEIRTPMNGVHGFARLLASSALTGEQQEYVNAILVSTDSLLSVINDILDYSKAESDKLELEVRAMNLITALETAVISVYKPPLHDSMEVIVYIDASVPSDVVSDAARVRQLVSNLMSNALKFSQRVRLDSPGGSGGSGGGSGGSGFAVSGEYKRKRREDTVVLIAQSYNGRLHVYPLQRFPLVDGVWVVDVRDQWSGSELNGAEVNVSEGGAVPQPVDRSMAHLSEKEKRREQRQRQKAERRRVLQERKRQHTDAERATAAEKIRERLERSKKSKSDRDASSHSDGASSDTPEYGPTPPVAGALSVVGVGEMKMAPGLGVGGEEAAQQASKSVRSHSVSSSPSSSARSTPALTIAGPGGALMQPGNPFSTVPTLQTMRSNPSISLPSHPPSATLPFILQLSVEDSAIGISAEMMPRLFGAFTQADASVTRLYQGSGLGLAISAKLAQLMGGGIGCVSQVGVGSRFTAVLQMDPIGDGRVGGGGSAGDSGLMPQRSLTSGIGLGAGLAPPTTTPSAGKRIMEVVGIGGPSPSPRATSNSPPMGVEGVKQRWSKQNFLSVHRPSSTPHISAADIAAASGGGKDGSVVMLSKGRLNNARDRMRLQHRRVLMEAAQQAAATQLCLAAYYNLSTIPPLLIPALPAALCVLVVTEHLDLLHYQLSQLVGWGCEVFGCRRKEDALAFMQRVYENQDKAGQAGAGSGFNGVVEERRRVVRRHLSDADVLNAPLVVDAVLVDYRWTREEEDERDESAMRRAVEDEEQRETERKAVAARQHQLLTNHSSSSTTQQPQPLTNGWDLCCALHHIHHLHTHRHIGSRPSQSFSHSTSSPQMPVRQLLQPQTQVVQPVMAVDDAVDRKSMTGGNSHTRSGDSSHSSGSNSFSLVLLISTRDSHELDANLSASNALSSASSVLRARLLKPVLPSRLLALLRSIAESPVQPPSSSSVSQTSASHSHFQHETYTPNTLDDTTNQPSASTLTLPTQPVATGPNASPPGPATLLAARFPLRILLAEDNMVNQRLFTRTMERFGYSCDVASNGREALELIKRRSSETSGDGTAGSYDVLFCDEQMPEMSGPETAYHIFFDWKETPLPAAAAATTAAPAYPYSPVTPLLPDVGGLSRIHSESLPPLPTLRTELLPLVPVGVRRGARPRVVAVSANTDRRDMENWGGMADDFLAKPLAMDAVRTGLMRLGMWSQRVRLANTVPEE